MSSEEIELLERVLLRLGCADTDEKLEAAVSRFLTPVILKITSSNENVRTKVVEVLTHIKRRVTSRPLVQIPVDALLDQYQASTSPFLKNFAIIFITMGYPRLDLENRTLLAAKVIAAENKLENYQDKLFTLLLPILDELKIPEDEVKRKNLLDLDDKPELRQKFLGLLRDVLLLPYGVTQEQDVPPGMSTYSFKRIIVNNWKAEDLEKIKKGIVKLISSGIFTDTEAFIPLLLASSDTRHGVATPAIAELSKVTALLDFSLPRVTDPLYTLFCDNNDQNPERKTTSCSGRVRQKVLLYLIRCRGKGLNTPRGIQVIFQGLFGPNPYPKAKVLVLQFAEVLIKEGPIEIISKVSKVLLNGILKVIQNETTNEVQNAAYSAFAQLARTCPSAVNDLKIVLAHFNHLSSASPELQTSIRDACVAMAPSFSCKPEEGGDNESEMETDPEDIKISGQEHLLLAMLSDNSESKVLAIQNVTSVFLTTCYPEYYAPARYLLLLIAGEKNSLHENIYTSLYGAAKRDHINYNMLSSIEYPELSSESSNEKSNLDKTRKILPSFKRMMHHVNSAAVKRLKKQSTYTVVGQVKLAYSLEVSAEILQYLRVCLWFSAGVKSEPGDEKYAEKLRSYLKSNYTDTEDNEIAQYIEFVHANVAAKRTETSLLCLYDILNASPELVPRVLNLLEPLSNSLKDVNETMRLHAAQVYGIMLAHGFDNKEFDDKVNECLSSFAQKSFEHKHGWLLALGHAFSRKIKIFKTSLIDKDFSKWTAFVDTIKLIVKLLCDSQWLMASASIKCISMIGETVEIPNVAVEIQIPTNNDDDEDDMTEHKTASAPTKYLILAVIGSLLRTANSRPKIREDAAKCLGCLAIGDGAHFTNKCFEICLKLAKVQKDAALNIALSESIVSAINGYNVNAGVSHPNPNVHCNDQTFGIFLNSLIKLVVEPNPNARQSGSVWLLGIIKHCSHRDGVLKNKQLLQYAFTELLSDDSEFVQDVASRGLGLVYSLSDGKDQNDLANSLLDQLIGGKRKVNQVTGDTELFAQGMLGKTPTGGNITTYKELCSLASDLNQPDMIYQFMQLANHNAVWTSKLGAAFGLASLSKDSRAKMEPYLGRIIPRLYRYKYDPTPKIQNSMISIWDSLVVDSKETVEKYYWQILRELIDNLTFNEWRVRIACSLAIRDLLKRPTGLRLRSDELKFKEMRKGAGSAVQVEPMDVDDVPEPELKELWSQLFRVMDDIHEGTRLSAQGTAMCLSKMCSIAASSEHGKSSVAVASSILPFLLQTGVIHKVNTIRDVSIKTITDMIDSSGSLITPHLAMLIPCLLKATGELEPRKLAYLSTRLGADEDAQETVDTLRAEVVKQNLTMDTTTKCVRSVDFETLEKMTPEILELIKTSIDLGTKIACAHFVCLISNRLGSTMTPLVGKYLGACFSGLKDRNQTVRKYYASAIGHLVGIAKEQSIKNLFQKLDDVYMENSSNRAIPLTIQSINKRHHELLKDYCDYIIPLVFFAMHEEQNEDNKANIELWKDLWNDLSPGDAGIRLNLNVIMIKLEKSLMQPSWPRKTQAANGIETIANRLAKTISDEDRLHMINILLNGLQGRTFHGKEHLLQALAALCKGLDKTNEVTIRIIEAAMRECNKEEPIYRTHVLGALGDILDELEADRFEEVYNLTSYLLEKKDLSISQTSDDQDEDDNSKDKDHLTADERNKRANILNRLKETVCETLGKSWPKHAFETQTKYQLLFAERCTHCLQDNTRQVQVSLLGALTKYVERLIILGAAKDADENKEKKVKIDMPENRDVIVDRICRNVLSAITYTAGLPHTGLKKESLSITLMLIKRLGETNDLKHLSLIKRNFDENLEKYQRDTAPEVRCRIKDIEDKLSKYNF